jgi:predicted nucleic acid-binding protein
VILLDTNVISELMRPEPNVYVERWFLQNEEVCFICTITLAEIAYGIAKLQESEKKSKLASQLSEWRVRFAQRTRSFDTTAALIYGELLANSRASGRLMSVPDAQISAIAAANEFSLCTRNISDFSTIKNLVLINPWG